MNWFDSMANDPIFTIILVCVIGCEVRSWILVAKEVKTPLCKLD
jgi:hypothetical protein